MAITRMIYKYEEKNTRVRTLANETKAHTAVFDPDTAARAAVTLTNTAGITETITSADIPMGGGVTSITYKNPGASIVGKEATLAFDGTWECDTVFSSSTTKAPTSTPNGTKVYLKANGDMSLTSGEGSLWGVVDYPTDYTKRLGYLPILIGA